MARRSARQKQKQEEEAEKEGGLNLQWSDRDDLFFVMDSPDLKGSAKIAGFDMDSTLIEPKSGKKFPTGRADWVWWNDAVPKKLAELNKNGYKVVIFTNQAGIEKNKVSKADICGKICDIANELAFPIQAFISGGENPYRKPSPLMWNEMVAHFNGGVEVDKANSIYCGDAAGRQKDWKQGAKKDFSCGDRKFASNIGVPFHTPEEFFLEEDKATFEWDTINPVTYLSTIKADAKLDETGIVSKSQEVVIMVGPPACGKSTFTKKYFEPAGYVRVNRDTLKTAAKCKKAMQDALTEGLSVVIDNTNPSSDARAEYISVAQQKGIPVRCFAMQTTDELVEHLNYVRVRETKGEVRRIPEVAYRTYNKNFEQPDKKEGFSEVRTIQFIPDFRGDAEFETMWKQWT